MRATRVFSVLAAIAVVGVACKDTVTGIPAGVEVFTATLTGANERPTPVTTTARATAVITVLGNLVSWKVDITSAIDSVTIGHIHKGVADSAGSVILNLSPTPTGMGFTGTVAVGSATVVDSVLTLMRAGRAYVNIHTKVNPGGEIRGQTVKQ
jgi:hypothetical protein